MSNSKEAVQSAPGIKKDFSIKVLGVGGAGCNAVSHLAQADFRGAGFVVMNTDAAALAKSPVETKLNLGTKSTRGLGAGGDPERGRAAAEEDATVIRALCQGADVVFVVAGLGGGTGTGASPVVAQMAKECGALVLSIVILPFDFEGSRRHRQAQLGLNALKSAADGVICLPNQRVFKLIDEKTSVLEAFRITNDLISKGVFGIWRLLSQPGLINVDYADLCSVTQGRHAESSLATAEARGEHRAREVVERLLSHPLMEGGQVLAEAGGVLVCIAGGTDLTMSEVNRVMEQINRQSEQAHIIMGATIDPEMSDRLSVTLLAAKGGAIPEPAPRVVEQFSQAPSPAMDFDKHLVNLAATSRPPSRFVAPPPVLTPEKMEQLLTQQAGTGSRSRKSVSKMRQGQLPLDIISKGRFEKSEPTIHQGQDLDVPTYIRRGVALN